MKRTNILTLLFGLSLFFPLRIEEKTLNQNRDQIYTIEKIDYRSIEELIDINSMQGDNKTAHFLDSLRNRSSLAGKVDSLTFKKTEELKKMVNKNSGKFISWKKFIDGLYKKYEEANDSLILIKENLKAYDLVFDKGEFYLQDQVKIGLSNKMAKEVLLDLKKLEETKENYFLLSRIFDYIPQIIEDSKDKADFISNLSLIMNESGGLPYVTGHSGDINLAQINPKIIPGLYREMRKSKGKSRAEELAKSVSLDCFKKEIKEDPKTSLSSGIYLFKTLKKNTKTEAQAVISYMAGPSGYYEIPKKFRDKIEMGKINSKEDITEEESKSKEMGYLKRYYKRKSEYFNLLNFIEN